jgi:hypothetical protein
MANNQQIVLFYVFIAFFVLIGIASLAALLGLIPSADKSFRKWAVPGFVGAVVVAVIGVYKASMVPPFVPIVVTLLAPTGMQPPPLRSGTFQYDEVAENNGKVITRRGNVVPVLGEANWQVQLPGEVSNKAIQLDLEDEQGKSWRTGRFYANYVKQDLRADTKPEAGGAATWQIPGVAVVEAAGSPSLGGGQTQAAIKFNNYARQNGTALQSRAYYDWRVFVDEPPRVLETISQVDYVLHPTFPEPFQSSSDRSKQFEVRGSGWGGFTIVITVHYTNGSEAKASYYLDLNKGWPADIAPQLKLTLDTITVKSDGSSGTTGWMFDVLLDGKPLLHLPNKSYSDEGGGGKKERDYPTGTAPVIVGSDQFTKGQPAHLEIRGKRSFGGDTAIGEVDLPVSGNPSLLVPVTNRDPRKGSFVFHFTANSTR